MNLALALKNHRDKTRFKEGHYVEERAVTLHMVSLHFLGLRQSYNGQVYFKTLERVRYASPRVENKHARQRNPEN